MTAIFGSASLRKERIRFCTLSTLPVIFFTAASSISPYVSANAFLIGVHHDVGMGVGGGEDQRLAGKRGVDVLRQLLGDDPVELRRDDLLVELLDLEADLVGRMGEIDLAGPGVQQLELLVLLELDARPRQRRLDADRRLVVDEVAVDHRLAVGVGEDRVAEDVGGVERRRGGQADLHRVEIVQHAPVFRDVVLLAPEAQFGVGHLAVEQIAAMALVDDHQIILVDGRSLRRIGGDRARA